MKKNTKNWRNAVATAATFMLFVAAIGVASASAAELQTYIVLYKTQDVPVDAARSIAESGGTLAYSYNQIGVAIARSDSATFRENILKDSRVENASSTAMFAVGLSNNNLASYEADGP